MRKVTANEINAWLGEIQKVSWGQTHCPAFLKPIHLVTIGLAVKQCGRKDLYFPPALASYASRMNLWETVGIPAPYQVKCLPSTGRFLPVCRFDLSTRDVLSVTTQLASIINKTLSEEYRASLNICIEELVNNFFDHANADEELPCLIAAQSWPKGKLVQVAIADAGIGIRRSLSENTCLQSSLETQNACTLASTYGISSKLNKGHSGYGLTLAKDLMKQANGSYILVSGDELYSTVGEKSVASGLQSPWDGTLLVLEWSLDSELNSTSVYNNWPLPDGFNHNDFF